MVGKRTEIYSYYESIGLNDLRSIRLQDGNWVPILPVSGQIGFSQGGFVSETDRADEFFNDLLVSSAIGLEYYLTPKLAVNVAFSKTFSNIYNQKVWDVDVKWRQTSGGLTYRF